MHQLNVGIVYFDSRAEPRAGIASLAGGEPVRISCIGDLDTSAVWISNLDFEDMLNARLIDNPRLRGNDFFRMKLDRLALEVGVNIESNLSLAVKQLSAVANRIAGYAANTYDLSGFQRSLKETIQRTLIRDEPLVHQTPAVADAVKNAFLANQRCYGKLSQGIGIPLRFSRTWYCRQLLSMPVPTGLWRLTGIKFPIENKVSCRSGPASIVYQFLLNLYGQKPFLARITSRSTNPGVDRLLDFVDNREQRDWVPGHEAVNIAHYSDVTVHEVLVADEYIVLAENPKFAFPHSHISDDLSISAGIVAENHWISLASMVKVDGFGGRQKSVYTPAATWLRAWDRLFCFKAALELHEAGYFVRSYGVGTINVHCESSHNKIKSLIDTAAKLGLSPPLGIVQMSMFDDALERRLNGG